MNLAKEKKRQTNRLRGLPIECSMLLLLLWLPLIVGAITFGGVDARASAVSKTEISDAIDKLCFQQQYHDLWEYVKKHYLYPCRLKGWERWEHKFDGRLNNRSELKNAVDEMLSSLNDDYTYVRSNGHASEKRRGTHHNNEAGSKALSDASDLDCRMLDGSVGYLRLRAFYDRDLPKKMEAALGGMKNASSYVLDLRENKGGAIDIAFISFGLFASEGVFTMFRGTNQSRSCNQDMVLTKDANVRVGPDHTCRSQKRLPNLTANKPIVVVVDENTRSAGEMLAGALRDDRGAVVVGSQTFGKGVIQNVLEFDNDSDIKVTSAHFFLPKGEYIHQLGITPDYIEAVDSLQIPRAISIAKSLSKKEENPPQI